MDSFIPQVIILLFTKGQDFHPLQLPNAALQFHTAAGGPPIASKLTEIPLTCGTQPPIRSAPLAEHPRRGRCEAEQGLEGTEIALTLRASALRKTPSLQPLEGLADQFPIRRRFRQQGDHFIEEGQGLESLFGGHDTPLSSRTADDSEHGSN